MQRTVSIPAGDVTVPTVVHGPLDAAAVPAVVVVPSIFGPAPDLLSRLEALGDDALVVVPDPFWRTGEGAVAYDDRETAFERLAEFDFAGCQDEMRAVADWARAESNGRVVGIGICFGGPYVLRLAASGAIDGVVTWHGSRMEQALEGAEAITCPMRHHFGSVDPVTPPEAIDAIRAAFADHPDAAFVVHDGCTHGFSHDGEAFDQAAFEAGFASVRELVSDLTG